MSDPIIWWVRRDFRLSDNPGLFEAAVSGRPVIPVFILDEVVETHGACPRWRLGLGAEAFGAALESIGSRLVFRRGAVLEVLRALVAETGAKSVWWARLYDPDSVVRDTGVKSGLKADGIDAQSFSGHVMHEPWSVETKTGEFYKVYTPFWKQVKDRDVPAPSAAVSALKAPEVWPASDDPKDWQLDRAMRRGADIVARYLNVGEGAALDRLGSFIADRVAYYAEARDLPSVHGTSRLSENLTYGEISPRTCWHAGMRALQEGKAGAEVFLKELVWREFAYHLVYHTPRLTSGNWRQEWDAFPWNTDAT
ncbi:MAG: deoxyribodipyrimidine photo-lyase, partial [Pseudomonadota bacterium]